MDNYDFIAIEDLEIKNMTKSAKGTLEEPGKNVAQKRGLNREIMRQSWGDSKLSWLTRQDGLAT